jgi:hypothetical protein
MYFSIKSTLCYFFFAAVFSMLYVVFFVVQTHHQSNLAKLTMKLIVLEEKVKEDAFENNSLLSNLRYSFFLVFTELDNVNGIQLIRPCQQHAKIKFLLSTAQSDNI